MKNVLFIHQSAELYGSDKALLKLLLNIDRYKINPVVIIPNEGPLFYELKNNNIEVFIAPVIKLHRGIFTIKNFFKTIRDFLKSYYTLSKLDKKYNFNIVYSNTLAVLAGYFFSLVKAKKHVWHVHEIVLKPKLVSKLYAFLLNSKNNNFTIYNSIATEEYWQSQTKNSKANYKLIYNGLEPFENNCTLEVIKKYKKELTGLENSILIGLVGRINKNKGHEQLIKAFSKIVEKHDHVKLLIVGTTSPNQEKYLNSINQIIENYKLEEKIIILPFQDNIELIWSIIDIAVVPSLIPESFGFVALEAMLKQKPVIASNFGGVSEIVLNEETGLLINPFKTEEIITALTKLITDEMLRLEMGKKGFLRAVHNFSLEKYCNLIQEILLKES
ncbi:MAG: glycosyltransferase family 4 protein [Flavobacterium sp.]|nr:glycosyltransferase family 4 protein [Flavobacterium sp.]